MAISGRYFVSDSVTVTALRKKRSSRLGRALFSIFLSFAIALVPFSGSVLRAPEARAATAEYGVASLATLAGGPYIDYLRDALAIKLARGSWVRIVVPWNLIQPQSYAYNWQTVDNALTAAASYGLKVLMLINGPAPAWAQAAGSNPQSTGTPPADPATFGTAVRQIATRYHPWVSHWEIWNEPNVPEFFNPPNAAKYTALLKQAYTNIHAVQPNATVMTGGLSSSNQGIDALDFVRQMYDNGAGNYFDAVALHPYTYPYKLTEDPAGHALVLPNTYNLMVSKGHASKKIWITEYGQFTGTAPGAASQQRQSEIIVDFLQQVSKIPWLGPSFLFTTKDALADPSNMEANFGLWTHDWTPKHVVYALAGLIPT